MRVALLVSSVAALALPAAALAKGPDYALLSGPGINGSIRIDGDGEGGSTDTPLGALVFQGGYPSQVFGHHPQEPTSTTRPPGRLGPRYRISYSVPTPTGRRTIVADVYPFAVPRAVTYMRAGQAFYVMHTHGGWYVAKPGLRRTLLDAGLPGGSEPAGGTNWWRWIAAAAVALAALAAAAAFFVLRRRPQSTPAPAA